MADTSENMLQERANRRAAVGHVAEHVVSEMTSNRGWLVAVVLIVFMLQAGSLIESYVRGNAFHTQVQLVEEHRASEQEAMQALVGSFIAYLERDAMRASVPQAN